MSETLIIVQGSKQEKWDALIPQIQSLIEDDDDIISRMANVASAIHHTFNFLWTGFYRVSDRDADTLILGPYQGPIACIRIKKGRGVCGTAWKQAQTLIVDDVNRFPGHIACSDQSKSEIVVPVTDNDGDIIAIIDIDSDAIATFDDTDSEALQKIATLIADTTIATK